MTSPPFSPAAEPPWITALILAGGQSSRMGQDKALIPWQDKPMIQHVSEAAAQCCGRVALLSPWPEKYQPLMPPATIYMPEPQPSNGPLLALRHGLNFVYTPWVLLLACDLPCLDPELLKPWISQLPVDPPPEKLVYVPRQEDERWEPLCGFYHQESRSYLDVFLAQGGRSFQDWLNTLPGQPLTITPPIAAMLRNFNTPGDLAIAGSP